MKKLLLSLSALFTFALVSAQDETIPGFQEGDAFVTGSVSFGTQKNGDYKSNVFSVVPKAGYFVSNNIALGVSLGYVSQTSDITDGFTGETNEQKNTQFSAGVFGRYYFNPSAKLNFFTELNAAYITSKTEFPDWEDSKTNGFGVSFAPGFNYFVSDHFALETSFGFLNYSTRKPDFDGAESTNSFSIGLDLANVNFGLIYKF